ncbi:MAG: lysophospholipid acyltransferase family protein [Acidimicrobiales bacterium]
MATPLSDEGAATHSGPGRLALPGLPLAMAYWLVKAVLWPLLRLLFRVRITGRDQVPRRGPAVLAANHQSFCDSLFIPLVVRRRVTYLAKAEYFDQKRTAWFFRAVGQIPIHRTGGDASARALATAKEVLEAGGVVALYPEGTRSTDGYIHRGRTGVARLAMECGVPVIPVGVQGTERIQPRGSRWLLPFQPVRITFGPPMTFDSAGLVDTETGRTSSERLRTFTDSLMAEISRLADKPYVDELIMRTTEEVDLSSEASAS